MFAQVQLGAYLQEKSEDLSSLIRAIVGELTLKRVTSWMFWQHIVCFDRAK